MFSLTPVSTPRDCFDVAMDASCPNPADCHSDQSVCSPAVVLLHIPVVGISSVGPVFDPNPALAVNVPLFPLSFPVLDGCLFDDWSSPLVLVQLGNEGF